MFLSVGAGARLSRGVWEHAPQKMFDLGTPGKPVLSSLIMSFEEHMKHISLFFIQQCALSCCQGYCGW